MVLNAGWNWLFFGLRSPRSAWPESCYWTSATPH
jgi:hypothetical protein